MTVPVPTPVPQKPKRPVTFRAPPPQPQPQVGPSGVPPVAPPQPPQLTAVVLPWGPPPKQAKTPQAAPQQMRRRSPTRPKRYSGGETTEDDFHRMLDANPEDHHTRLVFADWLQERNDPRAEGYRALGTLQKQPADLRQDGYDDQWSYHNGEGTSRGGLVTQRHALPQTWISQIVGGEWGKSQPFWAHVGRYSGGPDPKTRREAEDHAALAFGQLPPEEKERILKPPEKMSRSVRRYAVNNVTPRRYSATPTSLVGLFRAAREDPYNNTRHAVIADALDEAYPGNHISGLIRRQFGFGEHGGEGERNNDYYPKVENSWYGTFPYAAHLGQHGPFDVYLRHEGRQEQMQRWVVHAVARTHRNRAYNDFGYTFEFPHEEAHLIPRMFPGASTMISDQEGGDISRDREAQIFDDKMDEQERTAT